jgi:putative transposase
MNKTNANYRTITLKLDKTIQLDNLAKESGRIYSKTVSYIHKIHDSKGFWLDECQVQRIVHSDKLHSQTTQAIIQKYFASLNSYFGNIETNPDAKPPHKRHKYFCIPFKKSAIKLHDSTIQLSCGSGNKPIMIYVKGKLDVHYAEIIWDNGYRLKLVSKVIYPCVKESGKVVAVDPGEIHPITTWDGEHGVIYNGRLLRSLKQYREKAKASYTSKIDLKKKHSHRKSKLIKAKKKNLDKCDRRIKDVEHKITRCFVETCKRDDVSIVVYGDTTHIRDNTHYGHKVNQKIHQWTFDRTRTQIAYKLAEYGIKFVLVNERGTSHTCPVCGSHVNPNGRRFRCSVCNFIAHRDITGAINIFSKYQEPKVSVVASMAHATGVRFNYHLRCSDLPLRIPCL